MSGPGQQRIAKEREEQRRRQAAADAGAVANPDSDLQPESLRKPKKAPTPKRDD